MAGGRRQEAGGRKQEGRESPDYNLVQTKLGVDHNCFVFILEILLWVQVVIGHKDSQEEEQEGGPSHGYSYITLNTQPCTGYNYNILNMGRSDSNMIGRGLNNVGD